ncbi:MAG: hypothetical protein WBV31_21250 [Terriglobales bacterium]
MSYRTFCVGTRRLIVIVSLALGVQIALASNGPLVTGSYQVVQNTSLGPQAEIKMRIHLVNHGALSLFIQRMTLRDISRPSKGGTSACAVTLPAHASADTTQEFTIPRSEYEQWQKGLRPRFILGLSGPGNRKSTAVVRLDRISGQEAK